MTDAVSESLNGLSRTEREGLIRWSIGTPGAVHAWLYWAGIRSIQGRPYPAFAPESWTEDEVRFTLKLLGECCPEAGKYDYPATRELFRTMIDVLLNHVQKGQ